MKKKSVHIYVALVLLLSTSACIVSFLPMVDAMTSFEMPMSKELMGIVNALVSLVLYGGLGLLGLFLASKNDFPQIWNEDIKKRLPHFSLLEHCPRAGRLCLGARQT